jgi:hypothetical protein
VFDVLNRADSGADSLRQAILDANATPNFSADCPDAIEFNITVGAAPYVITLASDLPKITDPVNIRGYTQPGAVPATSTTPATIPIWINATNADNGLVVKTDDSSISGLLIGSAGSGSTTADGIGIKVVGDHNRVRGNHIGTNQPIAAPPSFLRGMRGDGITVKGDGNEIGSSDPQDRNVIAASGLLYGNNEAYGVQVSGMGNTVQGNIIGTDPDGTAIGIGNYGGVDVVSGEQNLIGGSAAGAGNLIVFNAGPAIFLEGSTTPPATWTVVLGNTIGTDAAGSQDFGNTRGVVIEAGSTKNIIGSTADTGGNLIVGTDAGPGIDIAGDQNLILHNTIGTDLGQTAALPNLGGISVTGNLNIVGGDAADAGNVVSGNIFHGISIADGSDPKKAIGNIVWGNHIGTDATDTTALGNTGDGIQILGGDATEIGGSGGAGFRPNVIAYNGDPANPDPAKRGAGVAVATGIHNAIVQNRIHDNGGLGIDLSRDGAVLSNDTGDGDAGPNGLQNYPLITGTTTTALGVTSVGWDATSFRTDPLETTEIDFYKNDTCDPSGNGEGQTLIGTALLGAGALPAASSTAMTRRVPSGQYITAIATSGNGVPRAPGRTSEFSPCFLVP